MQSLGSTTKYSQANTFTPHTSNALSRRRKENNTLQHFPSHHFCASRLYCVDMRFTSSSRTRSGPSSKQDVNEGEREKGIDVSPPGLWCPPQSIKSSDAVLVLPPSIVILNQRPLQPECQTLNSGPSRFCRAVIMSVQLHLLRPFLGLVLRRPDFDFLVPVLMKCLCSLPKRGKSL